MVILFNQTRIYLKKFFKVIKKVFYLIIKKCIKTNYQTSNQEKVIQLLKMNKLIQLLPKILIKLFIKLIKFKIKYIRKVSFKC